MVSENDGKDVILRAIVVNDKVVCNISIEQETDVYCRDCEIGYMLMNNYYSKRIMREAVRLLGEEAFKELDIVRIKGLVYVPNIASQRVLENNGFIK